ncbi:MAG: glycerol-3-phosphate responsive antiterminator [Anaerobacillus sp.]
MSFHNQNILPAVRKMRDFETLLNSSYTYIVLLDTHIGQLKSVIKEGNRAGKKLLLHADLVQGLRNDEHGAEFLCQEVKPAGLISTRSSVLSVAKRRGILSVQRLFMLDSMALDTSYSMVRNTQPDCVEVLPGIIPQVFEELHEQIKVPIFAGGFIRTVEDVEAALSGGAAAVTTSKKEIWKHYQPN